jgi:hypothetical protein
VIPLSEGCFLIGAFGELAERLVSAVVGIDASPQSRNVLGMEPGT